MHTNFSYLFTVLSIFHLFTINWRTFWSYIRSRVGSGLNHKIEFLLAPLLSVFFFVDVIFGMPPFSKGMAVGENFKEGWETEYSSPPVPHAEEYTITELSKDVLHVPEETIRSALKELGIELENNNQNFQKHSRQADLSPKEIYMELSKLSDKGSRWIQPGG
jgi:hypothetical protein